MNKATIHRICIGVLMTIAMASCGLVTSRQCKIVSERGAKDATALVARAQSMSEMEIEDFLLRIRANEQEYRSNGNDDVADAYIEAFETTLAAQSDSLASLILGDRAGKIAKAAPAATAPAPAEADTTDAVTAPDNAESPDESSDFDDEAPGYELTIK
jgi:hypothetical protein